MVTSKVAGRDSYIVQYCTGREVFALRKTLITCQEFKGAYVYFASLGELSLSVALSSPVEAVKLVVL